MVNNPTTVKLDQDIKEWVEKKMRENDRNFRWMLNKILRNVMNEEKGGKNDTGK